MSFKFNPLTGNLDIVDGGEILLPFFRLTRNIKIIVFENTVMSVPLLDLECGGIEIIGALIIGIV